MALRKLNKFQNLMRKIENRFFSKNLVQDEVKTDFRLYFSSKLELGTLDRKKSIERHVANHSVLRRFFIKTFI